MMDPGPPGMIYHRDANPVIPGLRRNKSKALPPFEVYSTSDLGDFGCVSSTHSTQSIKPQSTSSTTDSPVSPLLSSSGSTTWLVSSIEGTGALSCLILQCSAPSSKKVKLQASGLEGVCGIHAELLTLPRWPGPPMRFRGDRSESIDGAGHHHGHRRRSMLRGTAATRANDSSPVPTEWPLVSCT